MSSNVNNEGVLSYIGAVGVGTAANASTRGGSSSSSSNSWFEALARAWGNRLDAQATQAAEAGGVQATQKPSSDGMRAVLATFDHLNSGAESVRELANRLAAGPADASPSQIIQLTMASHQFLFQCELTSNVANRTSDGIQQLFRQQS
jgi:hypothetical protein